jgi:hypothetical protein
MQPFSFILGAIQNVTGQLSFETQKFVDGHGY